MATIAENLQSIQNIKQDIKTAIENKGVDMTNTPFSEYSTKIDEISSSGVFVVPDGVKFKESLFTTLPDGLDFSNVTDMSIMFAYTPISTIPVINTSKATDMEMMFYYCNHLQSIPLLDTANVTDMSGMFYDCSSLTSIPQLNTSKVTNMSSMFRECDMLQSIPLLDCERIANMSTIFGYYGIESLTDIGGFRELNISITSNFIDKCPNLTTKSLINIINYLHDRSGMSVITHNTLCFGQTNLDKLSESQIANAMTKGWILTA